MEQLADYLLRNFPVTEIALSLAETIQYQAPKPITISQSEFEEHFRIRGTRDVDGNTVKEYRGRPRKITEL